MNYLVKLSRHSKVMVPLVVVIGLSIMFGGAYVNKQQKIARENAPQETSQQTEQPQELPTVDQSQQEPVNPDTSVSSPPVAGEEPSQDNGEVKIDATLVKNDDGTVTIVAKLSTLEAGSCTTVIEETQFTAVAKDGVCEFKGLTVPVDVEKLEIKFKAEHSEVMGETDVQGQTSAPEETQN